MENPPTLKLFASLKLRESKSEGESGEYRSRTGRLLHAMQAL